MSIYGAFQLIVSSTNPKLINYVNDESALLNGQKTIAKFGHADGNR